MQVCSYVFKIKYTTTSHQLKLERFVHITMERVIINIKDWWRISTSSGLVTTGSDNDVYTYVTFSCISIGMLIISVDTNFDQITQFSFPFRNIHLKMSSDMSVVLNVTNGYTIKADLGWAYQFLNWYAEVMSAFIVSPHNITSSTLSCLMD